MKKEQTWTMNGFHISLLKADDFEQYYESNFNPLDEEVAYLTGSPTILPKDAVMKFLETSVVDSSRYHFIIKDDTQNIVGECVLSDLDDEVLSLHFRIGIFKQATQNKGLGQWAIASMCEFAFDTLGMNRLELEVFSFNPKAIHVYEKMGFQHEGRKRDAVLSKNGLADIILMSILASEWKAKSSSRAEL